MNARVFYGPQVKGKIYWCPPCDARVGCHPRSTRPLGQLANQELREARTAAHEAFDPLWRDCAITRKEAYRWLAQMLDLTEDECHIGMFDLEMCKRTIRVCRLARKGKGGRGEEK